MRRRVSFHTFGCKLNQFETEALASAFREAGFSVSAGLRDADAHVVNTCTVTSRADQKARILVRSLAHECPDCPVLVTGCSAQTEAQALAGLGDNVVVVPQSDKARILDVPRLLVDSTATAAGLIGQLRDMLTAAGDLRRRRGPFDLVAGGPAFRTRAFLKIQDGCDCRCAYCRVPLARGSSTSLSLEETLRRARELERRGRREIVLTGVNISSWRSGKASLPHLLRRLLEESNRVRFRLSSLEPEGITEELVEVLRHPRVCPHFHIPVQSGSDEVLLRMRRRYGSEKVREGVRMLRVVKEDPFLAADVIAGLPGETADDHRRTLALARELGFAALHVFPFSPRPSTDAASMKPSVAERIRHERAAELVAVSRELSAEYIRRWAGRDVEVLLQSARAGRWTGVSGNYLRVAFDGGVPGGTAGTLARCRITRASESPEARYVTAEFLSVVP